jgi:protein-tyrosine phosphatase
MHILFVCTGNLCRSPVAERLTASWARKALGAKAAALDISSAGTAARADEPMDPKSAAALRGLGGDPDGFRSRVLTSDMAEKADLVLTATGRQRRLVLEMAPRVLRRTFTLREAADLLAEVDLDGLRSLSPTARTRELALRLDARRGHRRVSREDDILDPIGHRQAVHHETAKAIATALRPLAHVLFRGERLDGAETMDGGIAAGF